MGPLARLVATLLLGAAMAVGAGCTGKVKAPPMPQQPNPQPAIDADPLEVERYQLEEEKRTLTDKYGANVDRIKQINARLIEINIELSRRGGRP